jgi:CDGSH-type Zn-finger protein
MWQNVSHPQSQFEVAERTAVVGRMDSFICRCGKSVKSVRPKGDRRHLKMYSPAAAAAAVDLVPGVAPACLFVVPVTVLGPLFWCCWTAAAAAAGTRSTGANISVFGNAGICRHVRPSKT